MGGPRGRLVSTSDREKAVELIDEARAAGARVKPACEVMGISDRTYQRWTNGGGVGEDQRPLTERPTPKNKLREEERTDYLNAGDYERSSNRVSQRNGYYERDIQHG